ncbi:MAG: hypothetical protein R3E91_02145 [Chlamydiales bacterium]
MDEQFYKYFFPEDEMYFHHVIPLHRVVDLKWDELCFKTPFLPRGWFELSRLSQEDRIEFTYEFWLSKLPCISQRSNHLEARLRTFFESLEDIEIFATQLKPGHPFDIHMVYALKEAAGFFHGNPPITDLAFDRLCRQFPYVTFPSDYLAFLHIHDGFCKYTDRGLIKSQDMARVYQQFQYLLSEEILIRPDGEEIDTSHLISFYESFELHCYQCFYLDWCPEEEMGNIYFSLHDRRISNFLDPDHLENNFAFPTFLNWLIFYLEDIKHI